MSGGAGMHQAQCVVYSKRTAKLMASVKLNQGLGEDAWSNLKEGGDVEAGKKNSRPAKTGKQRLRWNLIFNLLILILLPLPLWLPFLTEYLEVPLVSFILLPSIQGFFLLFWIVVSLQAIRTVSVMYANRDRDFREEVKKLPEKYTKNRPRHVAVISCYKEPVDLIAGTIDTLASQTLASEITMVVSFEERTPDLKNKQGALCDRFGQKFHEIIFTIHPYGLEDEIPGKCSNANCGIRTALAHVKRSSANEADFDPDRIIITTCDADSKFHPRYMEALTYKYLTTKDAVTGCVYQAPLLYNWKLDELSFVTRVTGIVRAFLMMGAMIPFNINTMSIFSFSASLCIRGDFIHPGYQMDDIIALIRWMGVCRRRIQIVMVPVPVLSGPTTGRVIEEEIKEWAVQARRWTIGAGEVFHYFIVKSRGIPFLTGLFWGCLFFMYYGVVLCCSSLYGITLGLSIGLIMPQLETPPPEALTYANYAFLASNYLIFAVVFIVDKFTIRLTQPRIVEEISLPRDLFHWIMSPFVLIAYSLVELWSLFELMFRGKDICAHRPSKKDTL